MFENPGGGPRPTCCRRLRLRPHGEGFEAERIFFGQMKSWGAIFRDFGLMSFWTARYWHFW